MWVQLFGNDQSCQLFTDVPLWYARFDGKPTFDDFYALPFGGWKQPYMKQYIDLTRNSVCPKTPKPQNPKTPKPLVQINLL